MVYMVFEAKCDQCNQSEILNGLLTEWFIGLFISICFKTLKFLPGNMASVEPLEVFDLFFFTLNTNYDQFYLEV